MQCNTMYTMVLSCLVLYSILFYSILFYCISLHCIDRMFVRTLSLSLARYMYIYVYIYIHRIQLDTSEHTPELNMVCLHISICRIELSSGSASSWRAVCMLSKSCCSKPWQARIGNFSVLFVCFVIVLLMSRVLLYGVRRPKCQPWGRSCRMSDMAGIWLWRHLTTVKVRVTLTTTTKSTTFEEIHCLGLVLKICRVGYCQADFQR